MEPQHHSADGSRAAILLFALIALTLTLALVLTETSRGIGLDHVFLTAGG